MQAAAQVCNWHAAEPEAVQATVQAAVQAAVHAAVPSVVKAVQYIQAGCTGVVVTEEPAIESLLGRVICIRSEQRDSMPARSPER